MVFLLVATVIIVLLFVLALVDIFQTKHAVRRNFPLFGRLRYIFERFGPELRQYIVTSNNEELPFSRDRRRWVYSSAKKENQYFGFGSDNDMTESGHLLIRHSAFPYRSDNQESEVANGAEEIHSLPSLKLLGEWRNRKTIFKPNSVVNISAMSFGSLSGKAVESLNRGAALAQCLHNTGEGGISAHHLHGGDLIFQLGTGYFGARNSDGTFNFDLAAEQVEKSPVRAIEIKLSQGAKPGKGGVLPGKKVTAEIAKARGVPVGETVISPAYHSAFEDIASMVVFIEKLADVCGVPVGIKSAVGDKQFWVELAEHMKMKNAGPDFISIDGGEGGTGAAPLVFSDHVSLPFRQGFKEVYNTFSDAGMNEKVTWIGSGKLGYPSEALLAITMGVDIVNVGREAMLAIGCIQAQKCHTGHCPVGVATQSKWLTRGLDPQDKSVRAANYIINLRHELIQLAHACGKEHPGLVEPSAIEFV